MNGRYESSKTMAGLCGLALLLGCGGGAAGDGVTASGTIEAVEVRVAAETGGVLLRLPVEEGSVVGRGDTLATVDHEALAVQLKQARAGVDLAAAQLRLVRQGARDEDLRQASAALEQAEVSLRAAGDDLERMQALAASGSATEKQRSDAQTRYDVARAQVDAAEQGLRKVQNLVRPEEIQAGEARLVQARAAAELLEQRMADAHVVAPAAGTVTRKLAEEGELVGPGMTLVVLSKLDRVFLNIYVAETELARVKLGAPARVHVDGYPDRSFDGRIVYISPEAEFTPKNVQTKEERVRLVFRVKIALENPEGILKPGLPADAVLADAPEAGQGG